MFILYYAVLSAMTPPVATAAYVASSIAEANPLRLAITACRLSVTAFVLPFAVMTLITFRFGPTKMFFDALYREAKQTGKPIVWIHALGELTGYL